MRRLGQIGEIDVSAERHAARVDLQDLAPGMLVGDADGDLAVETAGPPQGRIDAVWTVGRRHHDHVAAALEAVHQGEKLRDDALFDLAFDAFALGRERVDLVEEDDAGRALARVVENLAQLGFALAVEFLNDLRSADVDERGVGLMRHGAREQRLAAAGQPMQQDAFRRRHAETLENLGMGERQLDHFANLRDFALHAAEIVIGDDVLGLGRRLARRAAAGAFDREQGVGMDHHRPVGFGPDHMEIAMASSEQGDPHTVAGLDGEPIEAARRVFDFVLVQSAGAERGHDHAPGDGVGDLPDRGLLAECHAGVGAADAIELDDLLPPLLLEGGHRLGDGLRATFDLQHVAGRSADLPQRFRDRAGRCRAPRRRAAPRRRSGAASRRFLVLRRPWTSPLPSSSGRHWLRTAKYSTLMR